MGHHQLFTPHFPLISHSQGGALCSVSNEMWFVRVVNCHLPGWTNGGPFTMGAGGHQNEREGHS